MVLRILVNDLCSNKVFVLKAWLHLPILGALQVVKEIGFKWGSQRLKVFLTLLMPDPRSTCRTWGEGLVGSKLWSSSKGLWVLVAGF